MAKKIIAVFFVIFLIFSSNVFCQEDTSIPEYPELLKRVEVTFNYETDKHPTFYFQTVQPFYQSDDKVTTVFYQPRASLKAGDWTYNFGVGARKLINDDTLLFGMNVFGDYQTLREHGRIGIGTELLGELLEVRFNSYFGLTTKREVEATAGSIIYEKVANGMDLELGVPVPYLPWLRVYTSGFWYDFDNSRDKRGFKNRFEAKLNDAIKLEVYHWDDTKGEPEYGGRIRFNLAFGNIADFKETLQISEEPFPKRDLKKHTLDPVEREFDIVIEKWSEDRTGNVIVSIGRAN